MKKLTTQRKAILELINGSNRHWDAEALSYELIKSGISIGIATVYRGLSALDEAGLIQSIQLKNKKRYERADKQHHDHLVCVECGSIDEFANPAIEALQQQVVSGRKFTMTGHQLIIFGLCAKCAHHV